jgi:hypothetical protein
MGDQRLHILQGLIDDGDLELGLGLGNLNNGSGWHSFCCLFLWGFVCEAVRIENSTGRLVVGSGDRSSELSTLWPKSMVLVGGGRWVAHGRIWWALSMGTRGWCSVDDVAGF